MNKHFTEYSWSGFCLASRSCRGVKVAVMSVATRRQVGGRSKISVLVGILTRWEGIAKIWALVQFPMELTEIFRSTGACMGRFELSFRPDLGLP